MKGALAIIIILLFPFMGVGQPKTTATGSINFESNYVWQNGGIYADTLTNSNCIWQIGKPQKQVFDSALSYPNVIVTDTLNPYPVNDTSSFIIWQTALLGWGPGIGVNIGISGWYRVDSDTLNDFGTIAISLDTGKTWIDILEDTLYDFFEPGNLWSFTPQRPILTGNSIGWQQFGINFHKLPDSFLGMKYGDTILIKFSFISDSIQDNRDGLMFDHIQLSDFWTGVDETSKNFLPSKAYPNPAKDHLVFLPLSDYRYRSLQLYLTDGMGRQVYTQRFKAGEQLKINTGFLAPGIYHYRMSYDEGEYYSAGKFVRE